MNSETKTEARSTAQQLIESNVQALIAQLEAGNSQALTAYLDAMSRFYRYSFGNIFEISRQCPTATRVAGFHRWRQLGRNVRKGERGIRILAPLIGKKKQEEEERDNSNPDAPRIFGWRFVYVFDEAQTEGAELPTLPEITGDAGENYGRLVAFVESQGIAVEFDERIAPAMGMSYGGRIALLPGQAPAALFSTLVHEAGHELMHKDERRKETTKAMRETEAEAVAFIVSKAIGLNTNSASADYIRLYKGDAALLTASLAVIQHASAMILAALETGEEAQLERAS